MNKTPKKRTKKSLLPGKKNKKISIFDSKKKKSKNNSNIKIAFYVVFIIVILLILYFVNFKKPRTNMYTNDANVISDILDVGNLDNIENALEQNTGTKTMISLPSKLKIYKQSNIDASGPASIMNLLSYYGKDGIFSEKIVEDMKSAHGQFHKGTCINQIKEILSTLKIKCWDNDNYKNIPELNNTNIGVDLIMKTVSAGYPMVVGWNKNPGQWSVIVGYDNKNSTDTKDDEIVMLNSYDSSNSDELLKVKVIDFVNNWTFNDFFKGEPAAQEKHRNCFVIVEKNSNY